MREAATAGITGGMRKLTLIFVLFLAGCATRPEPAPSPEQPTQATPVRQDAVQVTGLTTHEMVQRFGRPALQVQEGNSLKLQFRGTSCVLDAYLYPGRNGELRVTHVDARSPSGADTDQAHCIALLEFPS